MPDPDKTEDLKPDANKSNDSAGTAHDPYATLDTGSAPAVDPLQTVAPSAAGPILAPNVGSATSSGLRFQILRPHARGGLGEVFVARDEELNREVALKEIQGRHADNMDSRARFLLEAEITGGLEHPGIVPVYGLGSYGNGRPYYAMRFIRGSSLKEAIEKYHANIDSSASAKPQAATLEFRALLGRFVDVCDAIAYAHSRGVLHRDLKPGNIMLGKYGETLVVDWGLAKPLGDKSADAGKSTGNAPREPGEGSLIPSSMGSASETVAGSAVGTPQYMSPEQAAGKLDELGPACDVYSLGATLFTLLTGRPAIEDKQLGAILQKVIHGNFPKPRAVKASVPAPLEAICLKAMALKPGDRYPSPRDLADDIEHWLADEPVSAWPEPWTVKARRWIGRHRTLVTGVVSAVVVAVVGLAIIIVLLAAANERERKAREKAEQNFQLARHAVDRYHTEVSQNVLLHEPKMEPLRKKLLEAAREFYEKFVQERAGDPGLQGELGRATHRLAQIDFDIGDKSQAIALEQQAAKQFETLMTSRERQRLEEFQRDLALCLHHLGRMYRITDQVTKSEEACKRALVLWQQLLAQHPQDELFLADQARTEHVLGNDYQRTRDLIKAKDLYQKALKTRTELARAHPERDDYQRDLAVTHSELAKILQATGAKETEVAGEYLEAKEIQTKLMADNPLMAQYQDDLARSCYSLGDLFVQTELAGRAEGPFKEAAGLWLTLIDNHPEVAVYQVRLAEAYNDLAQVYRKTRKLMDAVTASQNALKIKKKLADAYPQDVTYQGNLARGYFALAEVYRAAKLLKEAATEYQKAADIQLQRARIVPDDPEVQSNLARNYNGLAIVYALDKKYDQAADMYKKSLAIWEKLVKGHPADQEYARNLYTNLAGLGDLARATGRLDEALVWYTRIVDAIESVDSKLLEGVSVKGPRVQAHSLRADVLTQLKRYPEALREWERTLELSPAGQRPAIRLPRALAWARAGKYTEAAAEADELTALVGNNAVGDSLYRLASIYSLSAQAVNADDKRPVAERRELTEDYSNKAMKLLARAGDLGYFKAPALRERLKSDPDLQILRDRPEFKKLAEE